MLYYTMIEWSTKGGGEEKDHYQSKSLFVDTQNGMEKGSL